MRIRTKILIILSGLFITTSLQSQEIQYSIKEYIAEDGTIYWNKKLPIYLRVSPYRDGQGVLLNSENPAYSNPIYLDTEGVNYIRTKYAVDKETKEPVSPRVEVMMPIVADGSGPQSSIKFQNSERYTKSGVKYFGPGLEIILSTKDELSGVEIFKYQLDGSGFIDYSQNILVNTQGSHSISYYGVDRVGNKETTVIKEFIVDLSPPSVTHNINGFADQNIIASTSKIYFTASDEISGLDKVYYRFDEEEYKIYNSSEVKFTHLSDGNHFMEYYAMDKVGNKTGTYRYDLYFDKTAPLTASDILGDRFVVNNKIYFSGRTKMKLTAVDNKVGVKEIRYSIDGGDFEIYSQPFYLPSLPGEHTIRYYSLDRLANKPGGSERYKHNISRVYLDLTGPDISNKLSGDSFVAAGIRYISPRTKIVLTGKDDESGVQYLTYSIDGEAAETRYDDAFSINTTGKHDIELFAYDNVNNRNIDDMSVFVDASPPYITTNFSVGSIGNEDGLTLYPSYATVFLAATDDIVGNDKIYYALNDGKERLYTKPIGQLSKDKKYSITIRAIDMVGNESSRTIEFKTAKD